MHVSTSKYDLAYKNTSATRRVDRRCTRLTTHTHTHTHTRIHIHYSHIQQSTWHRAHINRERVSPPYLVHGKCQRGGVVFIGEVTRSAPSYKGTDHLCMSLLCREHEGCAIPHVFMVHIGSGLDEHLHETQGDGGGMERGGGEGRWRGEVGRGGTGSQVGNQAIRQSDIRQSDNQTIRNQTIRPTLCAPSQCRFSPSSPHI